MKTVVLTSDSHSWLLGGFFHQWKKYGIPINDYDLLPKPGMQVAGFANPNNLPPEVEFFSIGKMSDYPIQKWSDALIKTLESIEDELVMIMLEDYWLMRPVHIGAIIDARDFMLSYPSAIRFDLSSDRMFSQTSHFAGNFRDLDLCWSTGDYSLSFQSSIYRKSLLLEMLVPGESPWETELNGTGRVNRSRYEVFGSYQWPINYMIVVNKGKFDKQGAWMFPQRSLRPGDWKQLEELGYTTKPEGIAA
jgi:hypothetical protein